MSIVRLAVALFVLCCGLQGCGYQQMKKEQFAVNAAWSGVMTAYKERDDLVRWVADLLATAGADNAKIASNFNEVRSKVMAINASGMVTQEPPVFMTMKFHLAELNRATDAVLDAGSRVIGAGGPFIRPDDRDHWTRTLVEVGPSNKRIQLASQKYGLAAGTYNEIVSVFPNKWTARLVGFTMLPTFDTPAGQTGQPLVRTLTEAVSDQK